MSKRKRNTSSSTNKSQTDSLDEVAAISAAVKTFTVKDAGSKPNTFHNTGLPAFSNLREAEKALAECPDDKTIFSFELTNFSSLVHGKNLPKCVSKETTIVILLSSTTTRYYSTTHR
jgi:hypothetical protein